MNPPAVLAPPLLKDLILEIHADICTQLRSFLTKHQLLLRIVLTDHVLPVGVSLLIAGFTQTNKTDCAMQGSNVPSSNPDGYSDPLQGFHPTRAKSRSGKEFRPGVIVSVAMILKDEIGGSTKLQIFFLIMVWYCLWYYRCFGSPSNQRNRPLTYPYLIPFVGHTLSLATDPQGVVTRARKYFGNTRNPFTLYAFGSEFVFITNPKHVNEVYRHTETLTHDIFLEDLLGAFRVSTFARQQIFFEPDVDGSGLQLIKDNPNHCSLARLTVELFREQLQPGPKLDELIAVTRTSIERSTAPSYLALGRCVLSNWATQDGFMYDISLLNWCEDIMLNAGNMSFFGSKFQEVSRSIISDYLEFDARSWKAMFHLPQALSGDMIRYRENMVASIEKYFSLPKEERKDANWLIKQQEAEMRNLGISTHDLSRCIAMIFWVVNTNSYKLLFWMLNHLFQDPQLLLRVTNELRQVYEDGSWNIDRLGDMVLMPYTNALFYECLRVTNSSSSARHVTKDTIIGGYVMKAGMRVLVPYRQIHYDKDVFPDTETFRPSRFLIRMEPSGTVILNEGYTQYNGNYRPFGGGRWLCPGRHIAKVEVYMAMAYLLCRFDVEVSPAQDLSKMPRMDETLPGIGIVAPIKGTDLRLRLRERKEWSLFQQQLATAAPYPIATTMVDPDDVGDLATDGAAALDPNLKRARSAYHARMKVMTENKRSVQDGACSG